MELTGSHSIHGYGLSQGKDTHKHQPEEETHWTESMRVPSAELPLFSGCVTHPALMYDKEYGYCQPGKHYWASQFSFYWGFITYAWSIDRVSHMVELCPQVDWCYMTHPKSHGCLSGVANLRLFGMAHPTLRLDVLTPILNRDRDYLLEADSKAQTPLWGQILYYIVSSIKYVSKLDCFLLQKELLYPSRKLFSFHWTVIKDES